MNDNPKRLELLGRLAGVGLLLATGAIHLDLYLTGYRTIPTIGWLFLLQVISAFVLALGVLGFRHRVVAASAALFALSTLGGYLLSVWVGLFGFREVRTSAGLAVGVVEVAAAAVFGFLAVSSRPSGGGAVVAFDRSPIAVQIGAVSVVTLVAAALLAVGVATAKGSPPPTTAASVQLHATRIGHFDVLTNAAGLTLYLFVPDTSSASHCYGECAVYWPPVIGTPTAGPGVTGRLGTIKRDDGSLQATYDGHPLYTYVADSRPGQANGNAIDLNGGYWYEMPVSGVRP